jgi:hypothetical protein
VAENAMDHMTRRHTQILRTQNNVIKNTHRAQTFGEKNWKPPMTLAAGKVVMVKRNKDAELHPVGVEDENCGQPCKQMHPLNAQDANSTYWGGSTDDGGPRGNKLIVRNKDKT